MRDPLPIHHGGRVVAGPSEVVPGVEESVIEAARVALLHGIAEGDVYRNGQNSWSPAGWRRIDEEPLRVLRADRLQTADDPAHHDVVRHHSSWVMVVTGENGSVLLGCLDGETPRLRADTDVLTGWTETGRPGTWLLLRGAEQDVLARYRDLLADRYGAMTADPGAVWCSWYSLYEGVSQVLLDDIVPELPGLGFDTVQIDDGWERIVGDWRPNGKFPGGMRATADGIAEAGLRPGLWIAPFIALPGSEIVERHPEMLLRDGNGDLVRAGENWGSHYYTFDFTRADARDHLVETVRRAVDDWGFTYLKLDFINAGAVAGRRSIDIDREAAYRQAIATIRAAVGDDVFLLGSGAPIFPSLGILDAVRTGPDVAPLWSHFVVTEPTDALGRNALVNAANRLWLRGLIGLDPDVVYFQRRQNLLTPEQRQWLLDCATLSGFRAVSDLPDWLEPADRDAVRDYLASRPSTRQLSRYRHAIDERIVDFSAAVDGLPGPYPL